MTVGNFFLLRSADDPTTSMRFDSLWNSACPKRKDGFLSKHFQRNGTNGLGKQHPSFFLHASHPSANPPRNSKKSKASRFPDSFAWPSFYISVYWDFFLITKWFRSPNMHGLLSKYDPGSSLNTRPRRKRKTMMRYEKKIAQRKEHTVRMRCAFV